MCLVSGFILPGCQDTGTAIVMGKRGQYVWTDGQDEAALSKGVFKAFTETNLRWATAGGVQEPNRIPSQPGLTP